MPLSTRIPQGAAVRRRAVSFLFLLPLTIGLIARCGPSSPVSPGEPPGLPDPADAPRLASVSPGADEVRIESGDRVEFHVEATSPRSLSLSITFLVDGDLRATAPSFVFQPSAPGTYRVAAVVSDGELETTHEWTVDVEAPPAPNVPPTAVLGIDPGSGTAPLSARIRVQGADPDGTVIRWRLEVVGPDPLVIVRDTPIDTVLVLGAGDWQATAIVEDDDGATAVATRAIPVSPPNLPPVAILRVDPAAGAAPLDAVVDAGGSDPDGSVAAIRLDLDGDGTYDVESPTPIRHSVRFGQAGTYRIRLSVIDDRGAEARDSVTVHVSDPAPPPPPPPPSNTPPTAGLTVTPGAGDAPLAVEAHATGADADGSVVEIRLDFNGDGVPEATGPGPGLDATFVYETAGTRTVRATVVDDDGAAATANATVTVGAPSNLPPTGSLALGVSSGDAPLEVEVVASGEDPDGRIVKWELEAHEGDGFVELDGSLTATLVYGFAESLYRPRLRLTDDAGATAVIVGPPVTVHRPIAGGSASVTGNPRFDSTLIAPAVWSDGVDEWRFLVTVRDHDGDPLADVPLRVTHTRATLVAPDGTALGASVTLLDGEPRTGGNGTAAGALVTDLSTRIERAPAIDFQPFALVFEADAGHGQWRQVARFDGLNANTVVSGPASRVVVHPAGEAVCPGSPIEIEVVARRSSDAPSPGSAAAGRYTELRYADGSVLGAGPRPDYGSWRTDVAGVIRFGYTPTRTDQSKLVVGWVDGQPIGELGLIALKPVSECPS